MQTVGEKRGMARAYSVLGEPKELKVIKVEQWINVEIPIELNTCTQVVN